MKSWLLMLFLGVVQSLGVVHAAAPEPLLWQARGDAGTVYLLGSFHMLTVDDYPLDPRVEAAYARADRLVFEVDPAEMAAPQTLQAVQALGQFSEGNNLRQVLSASTYAKLRLHLGNDEALQAVENFKPWHLSMALAVGSMAAMGLEARLGLDQHFMQRAAEDGKPSSGLETALDQIGALDRAPLAEQDYMLAEALEPLADKRERILQMHTLWRAGDASGLERAIQTDLGVNTPQAYRLLNRDRNQAWLPQIQALLTQPETTLVVVGSMHLLGRDGLVELLRERGITVERVQLRVLMPLDEAA